MKKQAYGKKLMFSRQTIAHLDGAAMDAARGGTGDTDMYWCDDTVYDDKCSQWETGP